MRSSVILDGGDSPIGLESTIVSCLDNRGAPAAARVHHPLAARSGGREPGGRRHRAPRAPGDRALHYAPSTPLEIVASDDLEVRAGEIVAREEKVAVLAMRPPLQTQRHMTWINAGKKPDTYAHNLYNHLRTLDRAGCERIFVQSLPDDERWAAILDRLQRASGMGDDSSGAERQLTSRPRWSSIPRKIRSRGRRSDIWWRAMARRCS